MYIHTVADAPAAAVGWLRKFFKMTKNMYATPAEKILGTVSRIADNPALSNIFSVIEQASQTDLLQTMVTLISDELK